MTLDLEALKGLIAAATPGPWTKGEGVNRAAIFERGVQVAFARANHDRISAVQSEANAALIAAARTALPGLVEEVERLRKALEPFANLGITSGPDDEPCSIPYRITRGSIRNARTALKGDQG